MEKNNVAVDTLKAKNGCEKLAISADGYEENLSVEKFQPPLITINGKAKKNEVPIRQR